MPGSGSRSRPRSSWRRPRAAQPPRAPRAVHPTPRSPRMPPAQTVRDGPPVRVRRRAGCPSTRARRAKPGPVPPAPAHSAGATAAAGRRRPRPHRQRPPAPRKSTPPPTRRMPPTLRPRRPGTSTATRVHAQDSATRAAPHQRATASRARGSRPPQVPQPTPARETATATRGPRPAEERPTSPTLSSPAVRHATMPAAAVRTGLRARPRRHRGWPEQPHSAPCAVRDPPMRSCPPRHLSPTAQPAVRPQGGGEALVVRTRVRFYQITVTPTARHQNLWTRIRMVGSPFDQP